MPVGAAKLNYQRQAAAGNPAWQAEHAYLVDDLIDEGGKTFKCVRSGTSEFLAHKPDFAGVGAVGGTILDGMGVNIAGQTTRNDAFDCATRNLSWLVHDPTGAKVFVFSSKYRGMTGEYYRYSDDYGVTWSVEKDLSAQIPVITGMLPLSTLIVLATGNDGSFALGPNAIIARSTDGGATFSVVYTFAATEYVATIGQPYSSDGINVYAVQADLDADGNVKQATILHSADAGATWHVEHDLTPYSVTDPGPYQIFKITGATNYWFIIPYCTGADYSSGCQFSEDFSVETLVNLIGSRWGFNYVDEGGSSAVTILSADGVTWNPRLTTNGGSVWAAKTISGSALYANFVLPYAGGPLITAVRNAIGSGAALSRTWDNYANNEPLQTVAYNVGDLNSPPCVSYVGDGKLVLGGVNWSGTGYRIGNYASLKWERTA